MFVYLFLWDFDGAFVCCSLCFACLFCLVTWLRNFCVCFKIVGLMFYFVCLHFGFGFVLGVCGLLYVLLLMNLMVCFDVGLSRSWLCLCLLVFEYVFIFIRFDCVIALLFFLRLFGFWVWICLLFGRFVVIWLSCAVTVCYGWFVVWVVLLRVVGYIYGLLGCWLLLLVLLILSVCYLCWAFVVWWRLDVWAFDV